MALRARTGQVLVAIAGVILGTATAQLMPKAQVANLITKVERGVDDYRNYLERRGENARSSDREQRPARDRSGKEPQRTPQSSTTEARKDNLDDALGDLNRSTNRLRRKFDATDTWMETKVQVEAVLDDARKINQEIARGSHEAEAARLWGVLRTGINDLARAYGLQPLAR
jgi:uncharacterized coiled-coil DUF342 family protein